MSCVTGRPASKSARAFTLIELIVVVLVLGTLAILMVNWPHTGRGGLPKRLVCAVNVKGLGTNMKIYANDNADRWPAVAFDESAIGSIIYTAPTGSGAGTPVSPSRDQPSTTDARHLSPSRALWLLVRSGDVTTKQFVCPTSGTIEDPTSNIDRYYDFASISHLSYGYQLPFGPPGSRAREGLDNRMILAADRGPYVDASVPVPPPSFNSLTAGEQWLQFNSRGHASEGQNVLFTDGHASFERKPIVGADGDNIYTAALDNRHDASRFVGESPWLRNALPYLADGATASTDSLIFP